MLERVRSLPSCLQSLLPARAMRRFVRHRKGAAAVEFAFVALPFLALTFAIIETALVFFAGQTLETAVADAGRLIMTGQAQGFSQDDFKKAVCADLTSGMLDCNKIYVSVTNYSSFGAINNTPPVNNGQLDTTKMNYAPGTACDIVAVQVYYQWPVYMSLLDLSTLNGNYRLLAAASVFRSEPYGSAPCT